MQTADIIVIIAYIAGMIALGFYGMTRAKTKDDYLVAGRNLGPTLFFGTMTATVLGGASTLGSVKYGYQYGISAFWLCAMIGFGLIGLSLFVIKHILKRNIYTVTQVLEQHYNANARTVSALVMFAYALMIGVTSTVGVGTVLAGFFNISPTTALIVGGGIVVLYSFVGGMWSLTLTDFVQFIIMTVGLLIILLPASINQVGVDALVNKLDPKFWGLTTFGTDNIIVYFLAFFLGMFIGQDIWQRVFTARSEKVARWGGTLAGVYCIAFGIGCALIGMSAYLLLGPELAKGAHPLTEMIKTVLPVGVSGLVIAAVLSALMSTASAGLLAASTTFTQDIIGGLGGNTSHDNSNRERLFVLIVGILMIVLASVISDVVMALTIAYNILVCGMFVALIGGIFWKGATTAGAVTSMAAGTVSIIIGMIWKSVWDWEPIAVSLAISLTAFIVVSLATPQRKKA